MCKCRPRLMLSGPARARPSPAGISRSVIFHKPSPPPPRPELTAAADGPGRRKAAAAAPRRQRPATAHTQIRRSHAPTRRSIIFTRLVTVRTARSVRPASRRTTAVGRAGQTRTSRRRYSDIRASDESNTMQTHKLVRGFIAQRIAYLLRLNELHPRK